MADTITSRQGWQCPACHRCYSPDVRECEACAMAATRPYVPPPTIPLPTIPPPPTTTPLEPWRPGPVISWESSTGKPPLVLCETTSASGERRPGYSGSIAHYRWLL